MDAFVLSNGVKIPAVGFGTYKCDDGDVAAGSVRTALTSGYRHIDCAAAYANEKSVGQGIRESGLPREQLFVTSKVWNTDRGYDSTLRSFDRSCSYLGLDYLDLFLIHWPASPHQFPDWREINSRTWRALERLFEEGRAKAIGVSNFLPHHLEPLMASANVPVMVNQIEYHPGFMQKECVDFCRRNKIQVEAWSPIGRGRLFGNELLNELAAAYGKSVAQICLRWEFQNGVVTIPKSVNPIRIKENIDIFDFKLSDSDMRRIDNMGLFGESGLNPDTIDY